MLNHRFRHTCEDMDALVHVETSFPVHSLLANIMRESRLGGYSGVNSGGRPHKGEGNKTILLNIKEAKTVKASDR